MILRLRAIVERLASLWLTLGCIVLALVIAVTGETLNLAMGVSMAAPFAVLCVNLLAAVVTNPKLYRQCGLLGFHLALAGLACLAAIDQLVALEGHVEVTEGAAFDSRLVESKMGPLHPGGLDRVRFVQGDIAINYAPGLKRMDTRSVVRVPSGAHGWASLVVGDDKPLVFGAYRFYTSFNKGYAPVLTFFDRQGASHRGTVHLPSYPLNYYKQGNQWTPPGEIAPIKLWLHLPTPVFKKEEHWRFQKPESASLVVIDGPRRHELRPGGVVEIGSGKLRFDGLRSWMGYTITYNPLLPWMLAAAAVGILCLCWHVARRAIRTPWRAGPLSEDVADAA